MRLDARLVLAAHIDNRDEYGADTFPTDTLRLEGYAVGDIDSGAGDTKLPDYEILDYAKREGGIEQLNNRKHTFCILQCGTKGVLLGAESIYLISGGHFLHFQ